MRIKSKYIHSSKYKMENNLTNFISVFPNNFISLMHSFNSDEVAG